MNPPPTELAATLLALGLAGVELAPHPNDAGLLLHRPAMLHPHLKDAVPRHRGVILGLLANGYTPTGEAAYLYVERLGFADDLGMLTHVGSAAWLVAVGESLAEGCGIATGGVH